MASSDDNSRIRTFLICLAISQAPWAYYYFNKEAADELFYITSHTYTFPIVALIAAGILFFVHKKNERTFTSGELILGLVMLISATFAGTSIGYGIFTNLMDTELWHGKIVKIERVERYGTESCTTDKDGNKDCDCTSHSPEWTIYTNMVGKLGSRTQSISEEEYQTIAKKWYGNSYSQQEKLTGTKGDIACEIGNVYEITVPATIANADIPVTLETEFVNYIRASRSVFKIEGSDPQLKALAPPYPKSFNSGIGNIDINLALTDTSLKPVDSLGAWLHEVNALFQNKLMELGPKVKMNPLVITTTESADFGSSVIEAWGGLKKNDLLIIVSIDASHHMQVNQMRSFSLTKHTMFTAELDAKMAHIKNLPTAEAFVNLILEQAQQPGESGFDHLHDSDARYLLSDINLCIWAYFVIGIIALACNIPITLFFLQD